MRKILIAFLLLVAAGSFSALGYYGWKSTRAREVGVCVVTDYAFRQRPNWDEVAVSRFREANRIFEPAKIQWKILKSGAIDPSVTYGGLDQRRAMLAETLDCPGGVVVSLTGQPEGKRRGSVSPFSRSAIVVDLSQKSDADNTQNLAHSLAYFFGAPQEPTGSGTVMTEPPESAKFSDKSIALLRALRNYDLPSGISALTPDFDSRATEAIAAAATGKGNHTGLAHRTMAMALANGHKMEAAVAHLREAVKADPQSASAHGELASGLLQRSETDEALKEIREAVRLEPDNASLHAAYAGVLARAADPESAIDEVRKSIQISPNNPIFHAALAALCLQEPGYIDESISAYEGALKVDPSFRPAQIGLERARGEKQKAADEAAGVRKLAQQNASSGAFLAAGAAEIKAGNLDGASGALQKAIEMDPKNGKALVARALVRYLKKDYKAAWTDVDTARANNFETPGTLVKALQRRAPR